MSEIVRTPIIIPHNRRSEYNPEFLNIETLLYKYTPLLKSLHRYFCSYSGILDKLDDIEDLYNQIELEFIRLARRYDPKRGVDFSGYIKFNLRHRIYYWVIKMQEQKNAELLYFNLDDDDNDVEAEVEDETSAYEMMKIDALNSIPWDKITNPVHLSLIKDVLVHHKSLEEIAKENRVALQVVSTQFDELCDFLVGRENNGVQNNSGTTATVH